MSTSPACTWPLENTSSTTHAHSLATSCDPLVRPTGRPQAALRGVALRLWRIRLWRPPVAVGLQWGQAVAAAPRVAALAARIHIHSARAAGCSLNVGTRCSAAADPALCACRRALGRPEGAAALAVGAMRCCKLLWPARQACWSQLHDAGGKKGRRSQSCSLCPLGVTAHVQ